MRKTMIQFSMVALATALVLGVGDAAAQDKNRQAVKYSYATSGVLEVPKLKLKLLLDEQNLGGKELEMAEVTFVAGSMGEKHKHGSVEVLYVLSGALGHEVN